MENSKLWYQSTSILGSIVTVIALFASIFNYTIDTEVQAQIVSIIIASFGLLGSIYAIVGRVKATKVIVSKATLSVIQPVEIPAVAEPSIPIPEATIPTVETVTPVVETITPVPLNPLLQPILDSATQAYNQVITDSAQVLSTQTK